MNHLSITVNPGLNSVNTRRVLLPAEQISKSNYYGSQSGDEQKCLFHQEIFSLLFCHWNKLVHELVQRLCVWPYVHTLKLDKMDLRDYIFYESSCLVNPSSSQIKSRQGPKWGSSQNKCWVLKGSIPSQDKEQKPTLLPFIVHIAEA